MTVLKRLLLASAAVVLLTNLMATASGEPVTGRGESEFVSDINSARASAGMPGYIVRGDLVDIARRQAQRMASAGYIFHDPYIQTDIQNAQYKGENVGDGYSVSDIHSAFMNSPHHRANILDPNFTEVGVGTVTMPDGKIYVAEEFRLPYSAAPAPAPILTVVPTPVVIPPPALLPNEILLIKISGLLRSPANAPWLTPHTVGSLLNFLDVLVVT